MTAHRHVDEIYLHEIANVLVIIAAGIRKNISVVLSPKLLHELSITWCERYVCEDGAGASDEYEVWTQTCAPNECSQTQQQLTLRVISLSNSANAA